MYVYRVRQIRARERNAVGKKRHTLYAYILKVVITADV